MYKEAVYNVLKRYWGYDQFREMQYEIISSVLDGNDTLALLPTGGGKSLCFQVPGMVKDGLCLVVSPLIALMKDQVDNLKAKGIKAGAIYSGQTADEQQRMIDNAYYGELKFLYVSPERLRTDAFLLNIERLNVSMLAVDEAHCISQWGYDFRPAYLLIADIRRYIPNVPVLALTATATPRVVDDIQDKLLFKKKNVLKKSFERKNLSYLVYKEENKWGRLLRIANNVSGTGIVYVRSRKATVEIADFLKRNNVSADFYHAGLSERERNDKQNKWKSGECRIIASTNAFGMGIDKPDVRFVVHTDIPDNIEAYFQEVGRGGRDLKPAFGVLLYNDADIANLQDRFNVSYPDIDTVADIYEKLCNHYKLQRGQTSGAMVEFDMPKVAAALKLKYNILLNVLKILEQQEIVALSDAFENPTRIFIKVSREQLADYQNNHPESNEFLLALLRSYGGLFSDYVKINENVLANRLRQPVSAVINYLNFLKEQDIIDYQPYSDKPKITFLTDILSKDNVRVMGESYLSRKKIAQKRLNYMIAYIQNETKCRSNMLLHYFGEDRGNKLCGNCDYCRAFKERFSLNGGYEQFEEKVMNVLKTTELSMEEIISLYGDINEDTAIDFVRQLVDNDILQSTPEGKYKLRLKKN